MAVALTVSFLVAWWLVPVLVEQLVKTRSHVAGVDPTGG